MVNVGRIHYIRLFGFKASPVQRYFFTDNLISCRNDAETQTSFGSEHPIKYHRNCRAQFTNKRDLQVGNKPSDDAATGAGRSKDVNQPSSEILPDQCLFCKRSKYKPSMPPKEDDLKPSRTDDYIPHLLDVFLTALISRKSLERESSTTERKKERLKESFT